jgi:uncharacterized protein
MIRLLIYILLIYIGYKVIKSIMGTSDSSAGRSPRDTGPVDDIMIKDPVCGIYFPKKDGICLNVDGNEVCFCSTECKDKFLNSHSK